MKETLTSDQVARLDQVRRSVSRLMIDLSSPGVDDEALDFAKSQLEACWKSARRGITSWE